MPMYNASAYLRECIDSVLCQSFEDFEFIIVDDGSEDDSVDIVETYNDSRIRLIRNRHDYIDSLNKSVEMAKGKYIARMDSDDVMTPYRLEVQYKYLEENHEIDVVSGGIRFINEQGETDGTTACTEERDIYLSDMACGCCIAHPTVMLRVSSIGSRLHSLYRREFTFAEDYDLWVSLISDGLKIHNLGSILLFYRLHPSQISETRNGIQQERTIEIKRRAIDMESILVSQTLNQRHDIPDSQNLLTIVIPFLNEKEEVRNTILSIRKTAGNKVDIIVINDGSDDNYDYEYDLRHLGVTYIKNSHRIGAALTKEKGVSLTKTPYFLILDAHMRFYDSLWSDKIIGELENNPDRLLCSRSIALHKEPDGKIVMTPGGEDPRGAFLLFDANAYVPGIRWNQTEIILSSSLPNQIPCILGAGYASSRKYWDKLKGLQGLIHYGCEEAYLSIKAWREGGGCFLIPDVSIGHIYRDSSPYKIFTVQHVYNYIFIAETLFPTSEKCYAKAVAWKLDRNLFAEVEEYINANSSSIRYLKDHYKKWDGLSYEMVRRLSDMCLKTKWKAQGQSEEFLLDVVKSMVCRIPSISKIGLFDGLTGYLICLLYYEHIHPGEKIIEDAILNAWESLVENINCPQSASQFFEKGYAGVGWALIYMASHKLIEDDIQEELNLIDQYVDIISVNRMSDTSVLTGSGGIYCYVTARLGYNRQNGLSDRFTVGFLEELETAAPKILETTKDWRTFNFVSQYMERRNYNWTILPPRFQEVYKLPEFIPKEEIDRDYSLRGVIGTAIKIMINKNEEK